MILNLGTKHVGIKLRNVIEQPVIFVKEWLQVLIVERLFMRIELADLAGLAREIHSKAISRTGLKRRTSRPACRRTREGDNSRPLQRLAAKIRAEMSALEQRAMAMAEEQRRGPPRELG
ncbi:hypothetical protein [Bradyrhizobium sp. NAS96.2]|uniref:hypothetical protein n=1 Tax=Bradyrhizobium sp. NAS96.2 TaxID=1680160 RepID=UPI00093AF913|nr:hypothetical protein [Bradyrhizobium sp. NAS96.2]OKO69888.1 hypothetical protein AC628_32220 [Bradyrhizobium sp. NAS96.2]